MKFLVLASLFTAVAAFGISGGKTKGPPAGLLSCWSPTDISVDPPDRITFGNRKVEVLACISRACTIAADKTKSLELMTATTTDYGLNYNGDCTVFHAFPTLCDDVTVAGTTNKACMSASTTANGATQTLCNAPPTRM